MCLEFELWNGMSLGPPENPICSELEQAAAMIEATNPQHHDPVSVGLHRVPGWQQASERLV
jgi:hypothetical protein